MKVIVCGDRNYTNREAVRNILHQLPKDTIIIQGGCRGADTLAKEVSLELGFLIKTYYPEWNKYGKGAGVIRNRRMLEEDPNLVIAFHDHLEDSKGTLNMLTESRKRHIKCFLVGKDQQINEYLS